MSCRYFPNPNTETGAVNWLDTRIFDLPANGSDITMAAWVALPATWGRIKYIFSAEHLGTPFGGIAFGVNDPNFGSIIISDKDNTYTSTFPSGNSAVRPNSVQFLAGVSVFALNEVRFYSGTSVSNITLHSTLPGHLRDWGTENRLPNSSDSYGGKFDYPETSQGIPLTVGRTNSSEFSGPRDGWIGIIDQVACWYNKALTLTELREFAACGLSHADTARFYYRMSGIDPEPDSSPNHNDAIVHGTYLVPDICGGETPSVAELYGAII